MGLRIVKWSNLREIFRRVRPIEMPRQIPAPATPPVTLPGTTATLTARQVAALRAAVASRDYLGRKYSSTMDTAELASPNAGFAKKTCDDLLVGAGQCGFIDMPDGERAAFTITARPHGMTYQKTVTGPDLIEWARTKQCARMAEGETPHFLEIGHVRERYEHFSLRCYYIVQGALACTLGSYASTKCGLDFMQYITWAAATVGSVMGSWSSFGIWVRPRLRNLPIDSPKRQWLDPGGGMLCGRNQTMARNTDAILLACPSQEPLLSLMGDGHSDDYRNQLTKQFGYRPIPFE